MKHSAFYSWQSDTKSAANRSLIQDALDIAVKEIVGDDTLQVDLVVDRDTQGVAGSPDISHTIFSKIDQSSIFVADVTIVTPLGATRPMPNPNVMIELGYAIRALGLAQVILVQNEAFGGPDQLPFDLRSKRVTRYRCQPDDADKAGPRRGLAKVLEAALRACLAHLAKPEAPKAKFDTLAFLRENMDNSAQRIAVAEEIRAPAENLVETFAASLKLSPAVPRTPVEGREVLQGWDKLCANAVRVLTYVAYWGKGEHVEMITTSLELLAALRSADPLKATWGQMRMYPVLRLIYATGLAALAGKNYVALAAILLRGQKKDLLGTHAVLREACVWKLFDKNSKLLIEGLQRAYAPGSEYLYDSLREELRYLIKADDEYESLFNRLEYFIALAYGQLSSDALEPVWVPVGRFAWTDRDLPKAIHDEMTRSGDKWPPFRVGLFGSTQARFETLYAAVSDSLSEQWRVMR